MKLKLLYISVLSLLLLTGCGQGKVTERKYLRAVGVDGNNYTFAFFEDDQPLTVTASSPEQAKNTAEIQSGKDIFTGYTELIILRSCNEAEILTFMLEQWKVSPSCLAASSSLSTSQLLDSRSSESLEGTIKAAVSKGKTSSCDIIYVLGELLSGSGEAEVPLLSENGFSGNTAFIYTK